MGLRTRTFVEIFFVENHALLRTFQNFFPPLAQKLDSKLLGTMEFNTNLNTTSKKSTDKNVQS